jgi:hypothetical protein
MLNPFFLQGSKGEQNLIQDLINEQIQMYGIEVHYLPRRFLTTKTVIREVIESTFRDAYPIEAYIENYEGYGGQGTILSKFGIQDLDDLTLVISKERYDSYIYPLIQYQNIPDTELISRPKEGDLIYFPLGDRLFEIKFVEHEQPFYQLGKNYVYVLKCELFRASNEEVDTNIDYIDDNVKEDGYIQSLTLAGSGVTATAYTGLVNGAVYGVTILNRGSGYESQPTIVFEKSPVSGGTATGTANMISGLVDCNGTTSKKIQSIIITNPGFGYTVAPKVIALGGGPDASGFIATCSIGDGVVGVVTITNGGTGYLVSSPPAVAFSTAPYGGITATGITSVSTASTISNISMANRGVGYITTPTVTIGNPVLIGSGSYIFNEYVIGGISSTTARVSSWNGVTRILQISKPDGEFIDGETLTGQESGAVYKISYKSEFDITDKYATNDEIEVESDNIVDFTERNPFGMP